MCRRHKLEYIRLCVALGTTLRGAPDRLICGRVVGAGDPHRAAAGLPGVVLVLPGFAARLAGRRDHVFLPEPLTTLGIKASDPIAHALIAAGCAHDDLVVDGERS